MVRKSKPQWWITDSKGDYIADTPQQQSNHPHLSGRSHIEDHIHYNGKLVAQIMKDAVEDITDEFEVCLLRKPKDEELIRILRYAIMQMKGVSNGDV